MSEHGPYTVSDHTPPDSMPQKTNACLISPLSLRDLGFLIFLEMNQLAQRVESGEVFALKESLFAIKEKIDIALLNATSQNDIDQLRQRGKKLGRQLSEGLWIWHLGYNFRIELSPETLRSWRRSTERAC